MIKAAEFTYEEHAAIRAAVRNELKRLKETRQIAEHFHLEESVRIYDKNIQRMESVLAKLLEGEAAVCGN